jgi:hypothetical protein
MVGVEEESGALSAVAVRDTRYSTRYTTARFGNRTGELVREGHAVGVPMRNTRTRQVQMIYLRVEFQVLFQLQGST